MFDQQAIRAIQSSTGINEASAAVQAAMGSRAVAALPDSYGMHDLEKYLPNRRRARGTMATRSIADFAAYVKQHAEPGASIFIDQDSIVASAVLNLGTPASPGHADNCATLSPKATAAYAALCAIATGQGHSQIKIAEFFEDWAGLLQFFNDEGDIKPPHAIAAVRKISIESMRKQESEAQSLGASRSTFESVSATSKEPLPTIIYFVCQPYADLAERTFVLRLGVLTGGDKPAVNLRIVKQEEHREEMAIELAKKITAAFDGPALPVLLGNYSAK